MAATGVTLNSSTHQDARVPPGSPSVPRSAMNPDFEYALPTDVARMMGTPTLETVDEDLPCNLRVGVFRGSGKLKKPARCHPRGACRRSQLPMFVATQPARPSSTAGISGGSRSDVRSTSAGERGWPGSSTAPLAGASASAVREASLQARSDQESDAPGSTVVVAPYDTTHSMHSVHSANKMPVIDMTGDGLGRRLQWQLDTFTTADRFLGRFEMLGRRHRRCGGALTLASTRSF